MSNTALVLGANGRIGHAAVEAFAAAGWTVRAQTRRPASSPWPAGVTSVLCDARDTKALAKAASGVDVIINALNPAYTAWKREAMALNDAAIAAARASNATLIFTGNVYNFGADMPAVLKEDTPQRPNSRKGAIRVRMEQNLAQAAQSGVRSIVVRAGDYFGAGRGSWLDLVIAKELAKGRLVYPGRRTIAHAWAYVPDFARALVRVAERRTAFKAFDVINFPGQTCTGDVFITALKAAAVRLGIRPSGAFTVGSMPWPLLRAAGLVVPMLRELSEMAYLWFTPHQLDGAKFQSLCGPFEMTPLDQALEAALRGLGHGHERAAA